jgi:DNA polymerase (family X)
VSTSSNITNPQIAKLLRSVAAALSLSAGDNRFRVIAYERAADAIEHASSEIKDLWDEGQLNDLSGIGQAIASHLDELFNTGHVRHFDQILKPFPPAIFELMEVPGLGPKNALKLCKALGITRPHSAISKLEKAAKSDQIASVEGFGEDSQAKILQGIKEYRGRTHRLLLPEAQAIAESVVHWLSKNPNVKRADPLGSLRRQTSTVGDVDIAVATDKPLEIIDLFTSYPKKSHVIEAGKKTASIALPNQFQVDLMVQSPKSYGSLLQHFTGSKHHNIELRELALKKGLSLSEYGIKNKDKIVEFPTEEAFYNFLDLQWIPPELREGRGEIQAAQKNNLPHLVELADIKGDLHIHSDIDVEPSHDLGKSSIADLTSMAYRLKYEYIGLTEHNPSLSAHSSNQVLNLIKRKSEIVAVFNENHREKGTPYVFNGLEVDILPNGILAVNEEVLDLLDYACVSIHSSFRQSKIKMTDRVLKALDHPKVRFFAHPTGRLLNEREGVELDWDRIFSFCEAHEKWIEIDSWPNRLDLPDFLVKEAIDHGVKLIIDSDSHQFSEMPYAKYGVAVARRGWAKKDSVINSNSLTEMRKLLIKGGE